MTGDVTVTVTVKFRGAEASTTVVFGDSGVSSVNVNSSDEAERSE